MARTGVLRMRRGLEEIDDRGEVFEEEGIGFVRDEEVKIVV